MRWSNISLERFERILTTDESLEKQAKIVENVCITIVSGKPSSQEAMLVVKEQVQCLFSPVTQTCRFKVGANNFSFADMKLAAIARLRSYLRSCALALIAHVSALQLLMWGRTRVDSLTRLVMLSRPRS